MAAKFQLVLLILAMATAIGASAANSQDIDRSRMKRMYLQGLEVDPGLQDIVFGPFRNRRSVRIQLEYLSDGKGIRTFAGSGPPCIRIDRQAALRMSYANDARILLPDRGYCAKMPEYFFAIQKEKDVEKLPFVEDVIEPLQAEMHGWILTPSYARPWLIYTGESMLALQLHEIGHIVLHQDQPITVEREAEADGFALATARIADLQLTSIGSFLATFVMTERKFERVSVSHPAADCRLQAFSVPLEKWYENRPHLSVPDGFTGQGFDEDLQCLAQFLPKKPENCSEYDEAFHRGVVAATEMISPATTIRFLAEELGVSCSGVPNGE